MAMRGAEDEGAGTGTAVPGKRVSPVLTLLTAIALAFATAAGAYGAAGQLPVVVLLAGGGLAFLGLLTLFGLTGGFVHFGRKPRQRAFLDGLADAWGDPFVVTDASDRAVYSNGPYLKLVGEAGASRLIGFDVLYAGYPDFAEPIYQLALSAREGKRQERDIRLSAGSAASGAKPDRPVWLRASVTPLEDGSGRKLVLWRLQDISSDRAKQEQAFGRLQFIITYLDHAPAGLFSAMADGSIDYLNATLAGWLGLDIAEVQGERFHIRDILGEDGAALLAGIAPSPGTSRTEHFDLDLRPRSGAPLPVSIVHRADFDESGRPQPSRTLVLPRQARDSSVEGIRVSRFVNSAPIGIAEIDQKGRIASANAAFLALSPAAARGIALEELVAASDRQQLAACLAAARGAEAQLHEADVALIGDKPRAVQFAFTRLAGTDKTVIVFATDKTESRALEVQLAQSQKMQAVGQLASGIAHDFNNVLTPIIGFADLLLAKMRPTDPAFADIMNIKQNANRAANLVRQLLAFSRKQTLQPRVHSLSEALSDLGNLLGRLLGEKIGLKISHGRDLGPVLVDINQFEQVIINLAVNARDAMPEGGTLSVRTFNVSDAESRAIKPDLMPPGEYVCVEVEDTGTGIPKAILDKIWEPFFSTKDVGKGTGLGLSTVYGIVKQTGGFIFCDSVEGKGTTFSIFLPRHHPQKAEQAAGGAAAAPSPKRADHTGKGRILVVEDEDAVRAFAVRALTSRGYTVMEADSGERALEVISSDDKGFEMILSDVVMPGMDGPRLLREMRKRGNMTKVVFVSGYPGEEFEKDLEGQTGFDFLAKPFSLKQLVEKVKEVMEG